MVSDANAQKAHYERVAARYEAHYFDRWSMAYRDRFLYPALWGGLDLDGKRVAEWPAAPACRRRSVAVRANAKGATASFGFQGPAVG